jgi:DNA-binding FadR family transcriptional regulator
MADISDLPMLHDKLTRILRDKIESGEDKHLDSLPASDLADEYGVSRRVVYATLAMLAANRYVARPPGFRAYCVTRESSYGTDERWEQRVPVMTGNAPDIGRFCGRADGLASNSPALVADELFRSSSTLAATVCD